MNSSVKVMTILGPIPPSSLGITLVHEHLLIDLTCLWKSPAQDYKKRLIDEPLKMENLWILSRDELISRDNLRLDDVNMIAEELLAYKELGGGSLVELTPSDLGRNPVGLREISMRTGIHIICGCGFYVERCHPQSVAQKSAETLAEELVSEISHGIQGTGIKPGIIGEIGTSSPIRPNEEKVLRAAAMTHIETGVPINIHLSHPRGEGVNVLNILEDHGVRPERVALSHLDQLLDDRSLRYHEELAARGAYVQYDDFGEEEYQEADNIVRPRDIERVHFISKLVERGCVERLMISQDVCQKRHLKRYGGFGYSHILRDVIPMMLRAGITEKDIETMTVNNPMKFLAF